MAAGFGEFFGLFMLRLDHLLLDHLALERPDEVDQQFAGQVIVLVQQTAREQAFALSFENYAVDAHGANPRFERPFDLDVDLGKRQAAFFGVLQLVAGPDDFGIDEGNRRLGLGLAGEFGLDDEYATRVADLQREKRTAWTGVKNAAAQINLRAMKVGDEVLVYHTGDEKAVVGTAKVVRAAYADPTDKAGKLVAVDLAAGEKLAVPVTLAAIKGDKRFKEWGLVRIGRLSVVPTTGEIFEAVTEMGED